MIPRNELLQVKRIASRTNPRVKEWASLADKKGRRAANLTLADGFRLAREGLSPSLNPAPRRLVPVTLLVSDSGAETPGALELFQRAKTEKIERVSLADDCFAKISGLKNADGIALVLRPDEDAPEPASAPPERWLVADGVQDPANAGALARTALAAGCTACVVLEGVDVLSPKFLRGAMGACYRLPCLNMTRDDFSKAVRDRRLRVVVADAGGGDGSFRRADYRSPVALVVGGETGVSGRILELADERVGIPLHGNVESLNLAVAAGVILFEAERQWESPRPGGD